MGIASGTISACERGLSPQSGGTRNVRILQGVCDLATNNRATDISIDYPGIYPWKGYTTLRSNTVLRIGRGTSLRQENKSDSIMFNNAATLAPTAAVTVTISGIVGTITCAQRMASIDGQPITTDDYIFLMDCTDNWVNGVYKVRTLVDGVAGFGITIHFHQPPTTPSSQGPIPTTTGAGTILMGRADHDITIICEGDIDYNESGQSGASLNGTLNTAMCDFRHIARLRVYGFHGRNVRKFVFHTGDLLDSSFYDMTFDTASEALKMRGPMYNIKVDNVSARLGDDLMSIHTEESGSFSYAEHSHGDLYNIKIRNVRADSTVVGSAVSVYLQHSEWTFEARDILIENISGICNNNTAIVRVTGVDNTVIGKFDDITIRNVSGHNSSELETANAEPAIVKITKLKGSSIDIDGVFHNGTSANVVGVFVGDNLELDSLRIRKVISPGRSTQDLGQIYFTNIGSAINQIKNIVIEDCVVKLGLSGKFINSNQAVTAVQVDVMTIRNNVVEGMSTATKAHSLANFGNSSSHPRVLNVAGNSVRFCDVGLNFTSSNFGCLVNFQPGAWDTLTTAIVRNPFTAGAVTVTGNPGASIANITHINSVQNGLIHPRSFDIRCDVHANGIAEQAGNYCFHTGATSGQAVTNTLVICQSAGAWHTIGTG